MLKIIVCDDDVRDLDQIEELVNRYCVDSDLKATIARYTSGEELIQYANLAEADILFLDIKMQEINGLEVADEVRKVNDYAELIFITSYDEYMHALFQYNVIGYLSKPIDKKKFNQILDRVKAKIFKRGERFFYKVGHLEKNVLKHEIIYIESERNNLLMHLDNGTKEIFVTTLQDVKELLNADFVQINRYSIINMSKMKVINLSKVVMCDNTMIPISKNYKNEVMNAYIKYRDKSGNI